MYAEFSSIVFKLEKCNSWLDNSAMQISWKDCGYMPQFTPEYWEDDGWFVGRLVEVPGAVSQGETLEGLQDNIADSYKLMAECEPLDSIPVKRNRSLVWCRRVHANGRGYRFFAVVVTAMLSRWMTSS